jgi:hypothetical protein
MKVLCDYVLMPAFVITGAIISALVLIPLLHDVYPEGARGQGEGAYIRGFSGWYRSHRRAEGLSKD